MHVNGWVGDAIPVRLVALGARRLHLARDVGAVKAIVARGPEAYRYEINVAEVTKLWRRGSVVSSWLVDLTADAFARPSLPCRGRP